MKNENRMWLQSFPGQITCTKYLSVRLNSLPQVYYLIDEYLVDTIHPQILQNACEHGALTDDLEFILKRTFPRWKGVVNAAARGGYVHVFEWMVARQDGRCPWASDFSNVYKKAAANGHLEVIKWLHGRGIGKIDSDVVYPAARNGHLSVLQWLNEHTLLDDVYHAVDFAARNGHLEVVQWFYNKFWRFTNHFQHETMNSAARGGHLELLQWLHQQVRCDVVCTSDAMDAAIAGGHFDVVKWLFANCKGGCSQHGVNFATYIGNLPMLQFLHQHFRHRFRSDVMDNAAKGCHLDVLKWLHTQQITGWTSNVMDVCAGCGNLDVVRWLHTNRDEGCTTNAMKWAAQGGHVHVVKWLHENRSEGCGDLSMYWPVYNGHLEVVKWLVEHKPEMCRGGLMEAAAWKGDLDIVCFLGEHTRQCNSEWSLGAAAKEGLTKVITLVAQRCSPINKFGVWRMGDYARKLCSQLSNEGATTASPLWNDILKMLEILHRKKFDKYVLIMLGRALFRGHFVMVRQFFERRREDEKRKYLAGAAAYDDCILVRWLLENGIPLSVCTVNTFEHVEAAWWSSERDRVVIVCHALKNDFRQMLLLWVLKKTRFEKESSKHAIQCALKVARKRTVAWLSNKLLNDDAHRWCFPAEPDEKSVGTQTATAGRGLKRARGE